jgi:hypothetical protein
MFAGFPHGVCAEGRQVQQCPGHAHLEIEHYSASANTTGMFVFTSDGWAVDDELVPSVSSSLVVV